MPDYNPALQEWKQTLGESNVISDRDSITLYTQNVGGLERKIAAILKPHSSVEVQQLVLTANKYETPLWAFSTGRNWGLGSRLPVKDGCVVVDLHEMNRIREVNTLHGYVVIEPGVTQGLLWDYLSENKIPFVFDATGSGRDTSIIGNALDMGKGYSTERFEGLSGLEIVLGNGKILKTGFGHFDNAQATYLYKFGVGPHLDGLFAQSNYGIVTSAGFKLTPASKYHAVIICNLRQGIELSNFMDALANLRRKGDISSVVHISNRERTRGTLGPLLFDYLSGNSSDINLELYSGTDSKLRGKDFSDWSALGGLAGERVEVLHSLYKIYKAMKPLGGVTIFTDSILKLGKWLADHNIPYFKEKKPLFHIVEPLYNLTKGIPTNVALKSVFWPIMGAYPPKNFMEPDAGNSGLLFYCPMIPNDGKTVTKSVNKIDEIFSRYGFEPFITLNMINTAALEGVVNLAFDKSSPDQAKSAQECIAQTNLELMQEGIFPFRLGIQDMGLVTNANDTYWQTLRELKKVFDPKNIINPGRYNLI